jgi:hypothetical protein
LERSSTNTRLPRLAAVIAHISPAAPAPMMMRSGFFMLGHYGGEEPLMHGILCMVCVNAGVNISSSTGVFASSEAAGSYRSSILNGVGGYEIVLWRE